MQVHHRPQVEDPLAIHARAVAHRIESVERDLARLGASGAVHPSVRELLDQSREELDRVLERGFSTASGALPIQLQHAAILRTAERLAELLAAASRSEHGEAEDAAARVLLGCLARELPDHFALEERHGYLSQALEEAPRLASRVEALEQEHRLFTEWVRRLQQQLDAPGVAVAWTEVYADFGKLHERLLDHERAEGEILREAYEDDLGGRG